MSLSLLGDALVRGSEGYANSKLRDEREADALAYEQRQRGYQLEDESRRRGNALTDRDNERAFAKEDRKESREFNQAQYDARRFDAIKQILVNSGHLSVKDIGSFDALQPALDKYALANGPDAMRALDELAGYKAALPNLIEKAGGDNAGASAIITMGPQDIAEARKLWQGLTSQVATRVKDDIAERRTNKNNVAALAAVNIVQASEISRQFEATSQTLRQLEGGGDVDPALKDALMKDATTLVINDPLNGFAAMPAAQLAKIKATGQIRNLAEGKMPGLIRQYATGLSRQLDRLSQQQGALSRNASLINSVAASGGGFSLDQFKTIMGAMGGGGGTTPITVPITTPTTMMAGGGDAAQFVAVPNKVPGALPPNTTVATVAPVAIIGDGAGVRDPDPVVPVVVPKSVVDPNPVGLTGQEQPYQGGIKGVLVREGNRIGRGLRNAPELVAKLADDVGRYGGAGVNYIWQGDSTVPESGPLKLAGEAIGGLIAGDPRSGARPNYAPSTLTSAPLPPESTLTDAPLTPEEIFQIGLLGRSPSRFNVLANARAKMADELAKKSKPTVRTGGGYPAP